jgi:hypothetical protein
MFLLLWLLIRILGIMQFNPFSFNECVYLLYIESYLRV